MGAEYRAMAGRGRSPYTRRCDAGILGELGPIVQSLRAMSQALVSEGLGGWVHACVKECVAAEHTQ